MDEKEKKEDKITSTTTFDERRKLLVHKATEDKSNDLGDLHIVTTATIHEDGIKKTVADLETRKKHLKESIKSFEDVLAPAPLMTPELEILEKQLINLQLIAHKKKATPESVKKEEQQLKDCQEDLKKIEKDLKEIKEAIGSRLKI